MTNGIATVWLPVNDLQRAVGFYGDTLGLNVKSQQDDWAEMESDGLTIGLNAKDSETPAPEGGAVVAFRPDGDLERAASALQEKGVEVDGVSEHPWGRIAAFKDPDGNSLQFYEPPQG